MDFQPLQQKAVDHLGGRDRVGLVKGNHVGARPHVLAFLDGLGRHLPATHDVVLAEFGGLLQIGHGGDRLVVDDVAEPPFAAHPGVDERHLEAVVAESASRRRTALERRELDGVGAGDARAGGLGQQSDDVVVTPCERAFLAPDAVHRTRDHALLALGLQVCDHAAAHEAQLLPLQRVHVGVHGIGVGRHEDARAAAAHLVLVEVELRVGPVVHQLHPVLRLYQIGLEEVPVVVVPGVVVVEPGHARALVLGTHVPAVPVGHHDLPVRIGRGDEHGDDVVEDLPGDVVVPGGEQIDQVHARL